MSLRKRFVALTGNCGIVSAMTLAFAGSLLLTSGTSMLLAGRGHMLGDAFDYFTQASALARDPSALGAYYWPPGTGLVIAGFLRLFGTSSQVIGWFISLLFVATDAALIVLLGALLFGPRYGRTIAWLTICYPTFILIGGQTDSHIFTLFWVLIVVIASILNARSGSLLWPCVAGTALGMAVLTRPSAGLTGLLLPLASLSLTTASTRRFVALRAALIAGLLGLVSATLVLAPVLLHNHRLNAGWTVSTNNQRNFFLGNNKYTPLYRTWHLASRSLTQLPKPVATYLRSLYSAPHPRSAMVSVALAEIQEHPGIFLLRTFNRGCAFWGPDYQNAREIQLYLHWRDWRARALLAFQAGGYWLAAMLILLGTFRRSPPSERAGCSLLWIAAALLWLPYLAAFSAPVYHYEAMGLLLPLAGVGFTDAMALTRTSRTCAHIFSRYTFCAAVLIFVLLQIEFLLLI